MCSQGADAPRMRQGRAPGRWGHLRRAPPTSILRPPPTRASWRRCPKGPHLSVGGRGLEAVAVAVARGQHARLPMAGNRREGRGLPGDGRAGGTSLQVGRARARAGLRAGFAGLLGWRLAAGSWLVPWPGWEHGAAPPALGAGRAERGPDVSAGGFVRPQQGPNPLQARGGIGPTSRLPLGPRNELPGVWKPEKPARGIGRVGSGLPGSRKRQLSAGRAFWSVITHCADKETEARDTASRIPSVWQCCLNPRFRIHLFTYGLWVVT